MLNGIGKENAIAFSGLTIQDQVSDMLKMLDSNEHEMIKFNTMKAKLTAMQQQHPFMNFILRMEMMRDMMKHKFESQPNKKNMLKGFTPFVLQKMDKMDEINLSHLEEELEQANNKSWSDINKKSNAVKVAPIVDPMEFLVAIANTHALARILFTPFSPLTIGLVELQKSVVTGYHLHKLKLIAVYQPSWSAHMLWRVYDCCYVFFSQKLLEEDLLNGQEIKNPLEGLNYLVQEFSELKRLGLLACLVPQPPASHQEELPHGDRSNKQKPGGAGSGKEPKKLKGGGEEDKETGYHKNKSFNAMLKASKQDIINKVGKMSMGFVFKSTGQNTLKVLNTLSLPTNQCARYILWGGCGDSNCKNVHNDATLSKIQIAKANAFIVKGGKKLMSKTVWQD